VRWLYGAALCGFTALIAAWQAWNAWRALTPFLIDALGLALLAVLGAALARLSLRASPPGRWSFLLAWLMLALGGYALAVRALVALRGELPAESRWPTVRLNEHHELIKRSLEEYWKREGVR